MSRQHFELNRILSLGVTVALKKQGYFSQPWSDFDGMDISRPDTWRQIETIDLDDAHMGVTLRKKT